MDETPTSQDAQESSLDETPTSQDVQESSLDEAMNTITFKRTHLYAVLLPLAFVLGLSVGYLLWGRAYEAAAVRQAAEAPVNVETSSETSDSQASEQTQATAQPVTRYDVPVDDDPSIGPADAAITIIEFSDFECPYCRKWHDEVYPLLMENFAGQVRLVYRDFPLSSIHQNASAAAQAADCANEQGAYWEYHDKLFSMERGLSSEAYQSYAQDLGLDISKFDECLQDEKYKDEVDADFEYAAKLGVRSTPTFFINGIALVGAQPFEVFQQVIEKELAGEIN